MTTVRPKSSLYFSIPVFFPNLILQYNENSENITVCSHTPVSVSSSHYVSEPFHC